MNKGRDKKQICKGMCKRKKRERRRRGQEELRGE